MSRHWFGGGLADWAMQAVDNVDGNDNIPQMVGEATLTFWNLESGGTQYTDLLVDGQPADHVVTSDGSGGREVGSIPPFQGPEGVWWMWADGGQGRYIIAAWDVGAFIADALSQAGANTSELQAHIAATNPHATRMRDLADADTSAVASAADGQVIAFHATSGLWAPVAVEGLSGAVTVSGAQTITGPKTFAPSDPATQAIRLHANGSQSVNLLLALGPAGQEVLRLNQMGQMRITAPNSTTAAAVVRGVSGQSGNLLALRDHNDQDVAWVDAQGRMRAPNLAHVLPWTLPGGVQVGAGLGRLYNDTGVNLIIRSVRASVGVAPEGDDDLIVDILLDGASIFSNPGDRPTISDGQLTSGRVDAIGASTFPAGSFLTIEVVQVGDDAGGEHLTVQLLAY